MKSQMKSIQLLLVYIVILCSLSSAFASVPRPAHIVVCVLENHGYNQVIGCSSAPYINQLSNMGANMVEYYALTHPSQPNYLMLFSGGNQGVTTDNLPTGTPWTSPNLGASLINAGFSFSGFSEDLPYIGSLVGSSGSYGRKHSPWINWQGSGLNQISSGVNFTMDHFPTDFNLLPDVSFVIPNMDNDMHNGVDPARISSGDAWVYANLSTYVNWAMQHNSLLILLFDEDDNYNSNHIPCLFVGPMVQSGNYSSNGYHHYDLLRTIEDIYGLPYAGNSATAKPIEEIWLTNKVNDLPSLENSVVIYPSPIIDNNSILSLSGPSKKITSLTVQIYDVLGNLNRTDVFSNMDSRSIPLRKEDLNNGIYFYRLIDGQKLIDTGKVIVD